MAREMYSAAGTWLDGSTPISSLPVSISAAMNVAATQGVLVCLCSKGTSVANRAELRFVARKMNVSGQGISNLANASNLSVNFVTNVWNSGLATHVATNNRSVSLNGLNTGTTVSETGTVFLNSVVIGATYSDATDVYALRLTGMIAECAVWDAQVSEGNRVELAVFSALLVRPRDLRHYWPLGGAMGDQDQDRVGDAHLTPQGVTGMPTWNNGHPKTIYPCECLCG